MKFTWTQKGILLVLLILCGLLSYYVLSRRVLREKEKRMAINNSISAEFVADLKQELAIDLAKLSSLDAFFETIEEVTKENFVSFTRPLVKYDMGIQAFGWAPIVTFEEKEAFEEKGKLIYSNFEIVEENSVGDLFPAKNRKQYFPVYYIEGMIGNEVALGYDLASSVIRKASIDKAIALNDFVATERIILVQETSRNEYGFLVTSPVNSKNGKIKGVVSGAFRFKDLLATVAEEYERPSLDVILYDAPDFGKKVFLDRIVGPTYQCEHHGMAYTDYDKVVSDWEPFEHEVNIGGRKWIVVFIFENSSSNWGLYLGIGGCLLSSILFLMCISLGFKSLNQKRETEIILNEKIEEKTKELREANRHLLGNLEDLRQFAYVAAHDLKEPLRTIYSFLQLLKRKLKLDQQNEIQEYYEYILKAVIRMQKLIDNLHRIVVLGQNLPQKTQIDIKLVIADFIAEKKKSLKAKKVTIVENYQGGRAIRGYAPLIVILFRHLLKNCMKFRKKTIPLVVNIETKVVNDSFLVKIRDNGIGIKPEYLEEVFIPFKRFHSEEKYKGSGIGLSSCKKIVNIHGGKIWLESKKGEWTTVFISLPLKRQSLKKK